MMVNVIIGYYLPIIFKCSSYVNAWYVYVFPISRMWDFFIGCNLAYLYLNEWHVSLDVQGYTILEISSVLLRKGSAYREQIVNTTLLVAYSRVPLDKQDAKNRTLENAKYEAEKEALAELIKVRNELRNEALMNVITRKR